MQRLGKLRKALVRHNVQHIDVLILHALAVLIDTQAQTAPDLLAAGKYGLLLDQCANLKHIWIVPALFQRRVREDEAKRALKAEQPFLVPHDRIVGIVVRGGIALGVFQVTLLIL